MRQFRLVILDNTKEQLDNPVAKQLLGDMLFAKQQNFLRTDPQYVVMDKHDMIGTHYLIYDTTHFLNPKLVFAIRTTFLSRAKEHRIETPLMSLMPQVSPELRGAFQEFSERHPNLVDCNAWFVDPAYSKKNSGLNLSDVGYLMVVMHLLRAGYDNFVGCTNETYNASRWLEPVGSMPPGLIFEHPAVKSPHRVILMEKFNLHHFAEIYQQNVSLVQGLYEQHPANASPLPNFAQFAQETLKPFLRSSEVAKVA